MGWSANAFWVLVLCGCLCACTTLEYEAESSKKGFRTKVASEASPPPMEQEKEILSRDYDVANRALNKALLEKDNETIRLGLKNPILTIRKKTTKAIDSINDVRFVPDLLAALQSNQSVVLGGTEMQIMQDELTSALILTLERLTKTKVKISNKPSHEEIDKVITKIHEWLKNNPPKT